MYPSESFLDCQVDVTMKKQARERAFQRRYARKMRDFNKAKIEL
jgi:hypothetical protein